MRLDPDHDTLAPPAPSSMPLERFEFEDDREDALFEAALVGDLGFEDRATHEITGDEPSF